MNIITDMDLARLWLREWKPQPGQYSAPAAKVTWNGLALVCELGHAELDPAAAVICPSLARDLAALRRRAAVVHEPKLDALEANYSAATASLAGSGAVVDEQAFRARLAACRACDLWSEQAHDGRGRCESVRCKCSKALLWMAGKRCIDGKWPEQAPGGGLKQPLGL